MRAEHWLYKLPLKLRSLFKRRAVEQELDEELRYHVDQKTAEQIAAGMDPVEARRAALLAMGGVEQRKEECRDARGTRYFEDLLQDVRYGVRMLLKSPGFTAVTLITLALGIGANTGLFSVVNTVLLSPLPYPHPEQLVTLHMSKPNFDAGAIPFLNFRDWQAQNHTFSAMALSRMNSVTLIGAGESEYMPINFITSDFFKVLGVPPVLGRHFAPGEDEFNGPALVEISEGLWKRKFGGGDNVLGKTLNLSGKNYEIIGVVPADFDLRLGTFAPTDIYLPMGTWGNEALKGRVFALGLHGIGRIKPGVTLSQARADMDAISLGLAQAYPDTNRGTKANLIPLERSVTGYIRPVLLLLLAAVGFVLLIACVNVAGLLMARAQGRMRELAVRSALGASRQRIMRQLLTESVLLSLVGGGLGVLLAGWGTHAALRALPLRLPRVHEIHLDGHVLLFSLALSMATGILFGIVPALRTARSDIIPSLQSAGRGSTVQRHSVHRALVAIEVATALVLLIGAGLMLRTLTRLWSVDPGFDTRNVMMFSVALSPSVGDLKPPAIRAALREMRDTIAFTPGVEAVSLVDGATPMRGEDDIVFWRSGRPQPRSAAEKSWTLRYVVQPNYLRILKIPLLRGRFFTEQDTESAPRVVVVDDVFAATFFPGEDAIGQRIRWSSNPLQEAEIIGIVRHVKQWGLDSDDRNSLRAQLYQDFDQQVDVLGAGAAVMLRSNGPPLALLDTLQQRVRALNRENVVYRPVTMEQVIADSLNTRRFSMLLLSAFAALALLLAAVGIYGLAAYLVGQRTQEFGIRMALGAKRYDVLMMVMREGARVAAFGVAAGILLAIALTRAMSNLLFGISATDPVTFAAVSAMLAVIALAACYVPALRATRVDPMAAVRLD